MELIKEEKNCCGCSACKNICPKNAVSILPNKYGFLYPVIDSNLCIDCGLCEKACYFQHRNDYNLEHKAFASVAKDQSILMKSTSGGVFTSLALEFLKYGGYVAGAVYDEEYNVVHIVSNNIEDVYRMQGSKYVQSSTEEVYIKIRSLLRSKEKVLFSGTPCQVDGLYGFLQKDYDNLYTIDIVCHGVPSNQFFKDYLAYESINNGDINEINFRDKSQGWGTYGSIKFNNKHKKINFGNSIYYYLFDKGSIFRDACYSCKYSSTNRPADITIGDYWGIETMNPNLIKEHAIELKKGVSLIISNNSKGIKLIGEYGVRLNIYNTNIENVTQFNHNLNEPSKEPTIRREILKFYNTQSLDYIVKKFENEMRKEKLKIILKKLVPHKLKTLIKKNLKRSD